MKKFFVVLLVCSLIFSLSIAVPQENALSDNLTNGDWVSISDNSLISHITDVKVIQNGIILCIANGIVIRSTDLGNTFTNVIGIAEKDVRFLLVDGYKIYAITSTSVYFSDDYGITWSFKGKITDDLITTAIIFNNNLYVGTFLGRVMISKDFGKTFTKVVDTNLSTVNCILDTKNYFYIATNKGLFFRKGNQILKNTAFGNDTVSFIKEINGEIVALEWQIKHGGAYTDTILRKSADGLTFTKIYEFVNEMMSSVINGNGQLYTISQMNGILCSENGKVWKTLDDTNKLDDILSFTVTNSGPNNLFIGTKDSLLESSNGGTTFKVLKKQVHDLQFNCAIYKIDKTLFAGTNHGVMKRDVSTGTFKNIGIGNEDVNALIEFQDNLYAGTDNDIFVNVNNNWNKLGLNDHIYTLSKSKRYLFAGGGKGVYRINNSGFEIVSEKQIKGAIYSLYSSNGKIFAGTSFTDGGGLFVSDDEGNTWKKIQNTPGTDITSIFVDDSQNIFIGTWVLGIFYSNDNGNSWELRNTGLNDLNIASLKYNSGTGVIYCGTTKGIFYSQDQGKTWYPLGSNLSSSRILNICIAPTEGPVIVTSWDGIFQWKKLPLIAESGIMLVTLHWEKFPQDMNIAGYIIYRSKQMNSGWKPIGKFSSDEMNYTDNKVENGVTYFYFVKSFDNDTPPHYFISNIVSSTPYVDDTPPIVTITRPKSISTTVNHSSVKVSGTITDDYSIKSAEINHNAIKLDNSGHFETTIYLNEGQNTITIIATDEAGNKTTKILSVTYKSQIVITLQPDNLMMTVNGVQQEIDPGRGTKPVIIPKWGRTVVPIRAIVEALGGTIEWDGAERKVTINFNDTVIELWIDKPQASVNDEMKWIDENNHDVKPIIVNSRTMLPLRFVAENLGCTVGWDNDTKTITITYGG